MKNNLNKTLTNIFELISHQANIGCLSGKNLSMEQEENIQLLRILDNEIETPARNILPLLKNQNSLDDEKVDLNKLTALLKLLNKNNSIIRLNHVGFGYKIKSAAEEKSELIKNLKYSPLNLYEEPSGDNYSKWIFMGDISNWQNPTIEFVIIEKTTDKYQEYWLPHVQIDLDTTLDSKEIQELIKKVYEDEIVPFPIIIDDVTYIMRCALGRVYGVNIFLDLATNARDVKYLKGIVWKKIK